VLSFARTVKEEICFNDFDDASAKALLSALIKITGRIHLGGGMTLEIRTENAKIASKAHKLLKALYNPSIQFKVKRKMKLHKNNVYILMVSKAQVICESLGLLEGLGFTSVPPESVVYDDATRRGYLAGAFLAAGSVNNPDTSNYHLEISLTDPDQAQYLMKVMNAYDLRAKVITRRSRSVVYIKAAEKIGDFMRAIGASRSVTQFEITRIDRDMANTVNRLNNCDIANEIKAMSASRKQIEDIAYIIDKRGLEMLDRKTAMAAIVRLENPESTLNELTAAYQEKTGTTISKSGLYHRFKKIGDEADRLRKLEQDNDD